MKKLAAILLLLVFSFNLIGYKFLFDYLQHRSDVQLEGALDRAQYNEKDLISIRLPLSMPYQPQNTDFERVDGEITRDGIIYKYVKRKIDQGALVLLCLPNRKKMQLESGKGQFFQLANEFEQFAPKSHVPAKATTIFKLSVFDVPHFRIAAPTPLVFHLSHPLCNHIVLPQPFISDPGQPPNGTLFS